MLASDVNNTQFVGAHNPDSALAVRFHSKAVQNMFESDKQGRPIFNDIVYIEIFTPGDSLNIIDTPVRDAHKMRFPQQWAQYQLAHGTDTRMMGTPLTEWTYLSAAQAEELKALKFFTVESLANASDLQIGSIGMIGGMAPLQLRARAQAFLNAAAGTADVEHQASQNAKLQDQISALQAQIAAMSKHTAIEPAPVAYVKHEKAVDSQKRRGRPSKSATFVENVESPQVV